MRSAILATVWLLVTCCEKVVCPSVCNVGGLWSRRLVLRK